MVDVVKKIDELRKDRGWSIYKLSIETGLTQQAIHAWFSAKKNAVPSIATLEIVCDAFGITLADFFTEKHVVEIMPQVKSIYENWYALSREEQVLIDTLIAKLIRK